MPPRFGKKKNWKSKKKRSSPNVFAFFKEFFQSRIMQLGLVLLILFFLIVGKLFKIQVLDYNFYSVVAANAHEIYKEITPERGEIYLRANDETDKLIPLVKNRSMEMVYAVPKYIENPGEIAEKLSGILEKDTETLREKLDKEDDPYEPLARRLDEEQVKEIQAIETTGLGFVKENWRYYVQPQLGGQILGFYGYAGDDRRGAYGIEGYFENELAGTPGELQAEKDVAGRWIALTEKKFIPSVDGADIVLTLDRTIQFQACESLRNAVAKHGADKGSVIILQPDTGKVLAMCNAPDYDPNTYSEVDDPSVYNNAAVFDTYEPGSVFKPVTMASALDTGAVSPDTTYEDTGVVEIDVYDIENSDKKAHGVQTMTQVLEKSLNTGTIYAARQAGLTKFREYVQKFGFGEKTGIQLEGESAGNIRSLNYENTDIYLATGSFGQGLTVTPLQMVNAFATIANGGNLMKPYIVQEIIKADGTHLKTEPQVKREVISSRTSTLLGGMLVSVIRNGHGGRAGVDGYLLAGKTGTAQAAENGEYLDKTIHSFVGFGPVDDPRFAMIVKLDDPKDVEFSSDSAAPLFGELAEFLVEYYRIPPSE